MRDSTVRERAETFFGVREQRRQSPYWLSFVLIAIAIAIETVLRDNFHMAWWLALLIAVAVVGVPVRVWWMVKKRHDRAAGLE